MKKKFVILFFLFLSFASFTLLWWRQAVKPINSDSQQVSSFVIGKGENIRIISDKLNKQKLIRSPVAFFLLVRFAGFADKIQAGYFRLKPSMNLYEIARELTHGTNDVWITIPEGWRSEEIALKLTQEFAVPESEYNKFMKEGYMFPDTYLIPKDASPSAIVSLFLENFNKKITEKIKEESKNLTLADIITIASLVEREAKFAVDRPLIASVILNRLKMGMKLDIDATVQYALGYQPAQKSWWKKGLTREDLQIDSPFNTYLNAGLPPSPIANPGLSAVMAVINAQETEYYYYLADKTGKTHFATTFEEHQMNISRYLQ